MDATIGYLGQVREDLMDAAFRTGQAGRGQVRRPRRLASGRVLVAASSVVVLVAAGTLGWFVTHGDPFSSLARTGPANGATGATGAPEGVAAPSPAPADSLFEPYTGDEAAFIGHEAAGQAAGGVVDFGGPAPSVLVGDGARIVRTAEMTLVLPPDTFDERFASAQAVAELHGGFVQTSTGRERSGTLVMRVPSGQFATAMRDLRALGDVEVQTVRGEDVTAQYVDLQARLRIARARRDVLLDLMAKAVSIEQTIRVQNALDDTQLRIEELQGTIGLLQDRTSFATIRVQLHEEGVEPEVDVKNPSVTGAWDRAIAGFFGVVAGIIVGLGYLLPILAIGAVVWFAVRWVRRRRAA
jgi:hypothetical protein